MESRPSFTAHQIADAVDGEVVGDGDVRFTGFASAQEAGPGDLTFAENAEFFEKARQSPAAGILVSGDLGSAEKALIRVRNARIAFAKVLPLFFPEPKFEPGVDSSAVVSPKASVDPSVHIGPACVVGDGAVIGAGCVLEAQCFVGRGSRLGESVRLFPHVTIYPGTTIGNRVRIHAQSVVGSDGFGYVFVDGVHQKIPQVGTTVIEDDVEIGAGVTIDRGALGPTVIGQGSRIDNLVQIAHNVQIGKGCIVVAQAGIAGSTTLGDYTTLAGQVGVAGHLTLGSRVTVAGQSGVMHSIPDGQQWMGSPAQEHQKAKRQILATHQLPEMRKRLRELERQVESLMAAR